MTIHFIDLLPVLLFAISSTFTPGPNNFLLMNSGLSHGIKKSLPLYFGITFGFPLMVLFIALGFGAIFLKYLWLKQILKILGILYILYLTWKVISSVSDGDNKANSKPISFLQAVSFQWINPKAWLMAVGAISIFTISTHYFLNAIFISVLFLLICIPSSGVWLLFGSFLQKIIHNKKRQKQINFLLAFCLLASIYLIIFD